MSYYYLILVLQAVCVFHAIRSQNQNKWIWIIVFLPVVGCIAYIFSEILTKNKIQNTQVVLNKAINPGGQVKKLEQELKVSDSFENRIALADAYLSINRLLEAQELYEESLNGIFKDNQHVIQQLCKVYYLLEKYPNTLPLIEKIKANKEFNSSETHIIYALTLEQLGRYDQAEKEFLSMFAKFSNYECRFNYGQFLVRRNKIAGAKEIFEQLLEESYHLKGFERKHNRIWFSGAREELKKIDILSATVSPTE